MGAAYSPAETMLIPSTIKNPLKPKPVPIWDACNMTLANVSYRYPDVKKSTLAVKKFSLSISSGEKIGIVGHSRQRKNNLIEITAPFYGRVIW